MLSRCGVARKAAFLSCQTLLRSTDIFMSRIRLCGQPGNPEARKRGLRDQFSSQRSISPSEQIFEQRPGVSPRPAAGTAIPWPVNRQLEAGLMSRPSRRSGGTSWTSHTANHTSRGWYPEANASTAVLPPTPASTKEPARTREYPGPNSSSINRQKSLALTDRVSHGAGL